MFRKRLLILTLFVIALAGCVTSLNQLGPVSAEAEETQSVIVPGVPALTVNHFAGTVTVRDGEADQITAHLTKQSRLRDDAEAQAQLDEIVMTFTQNGTAVTLSVEGPEETAGIAVGASGELEVLVPPGTDLDINHGAGDVTVEQPSGDVTVNLGAGQATVSLPDEASFRLKVTGGVTDVNSEFEGVPEGGLAAHVDATVGDNPTQTLSFNLGAGDINLKKAQ